MVIQLGAYQLDNIYQGDARKLLENLPDQCIDLVLTSPPYGSLRDYGGEEFTFMVFSGIAKEIARVIKPGGVVVWVVADETDHTGETGQSFLQAIFFKSIGLRLHDTMIYMKAGPAYPSQDKYYQVFEYMFVFSKGKPKTFNPLMDRKNRFYNDKWSKVRTRRHKDGSIKKQTWLADEMYTREFGVRFNIWQYPVGYGYHGDRYCHEHPASFPENLARDHIESWSKPGDIVLDPMCGSGTTCKMAYLTRRHYLGFDVYDKYCDLARRRLQATNPSLFILEDHK